MKNIFKKRKDLRLICNNCWQNLYLLDFLENPEKIIKASKMRCPYCKTKGDWRGNWRLNGMGSYEEAQKEYERLEKLSQNIKKVDKYLNEK